MFRHSMPAMQNGLTSLKGSIISSLKECVSCLDSTLFLVLFFFEAIDTPLCIGWALALDNAGAMEPKIPWFHRRQVATTTTTNQNCNCTLIS